jgi:hypothetical protein
MSVIHKYNEYMSGICELWENKAICMSVMQKQKDM